MRDWMNMSHAGIEWAWELEVKLVSIDGYVKGQIGL